MEEVTNSVKNYLREQHGALEVKDVDLLPIDRAFKFVIIAHGNNAEETEGRHFLFKSSGERFSGTTETLEL